MKKQVSKNTEDTKTGEPKNSAPLYLRYTGMAVSVLVLVAAFGAIVANEDDYLYRVQELNLFLYTPLFFKQQLVVAGGMLTWLGTYFTQFFYHIWLGTLMLIGWLALFMWLVKQTFKLPASWMPLLLIPAGLMLITDFNLGYWVYILKLRGHFFIGVMGMSMAVALVWLYRVVAAKAFAKDSSLATALLVVFQIVVGFLAYIVGGFYGLLALLLMAVVSVKLKSALTAKIIAIAISLLLIVVVPLISYRLIYYQTNSDYVWWQMLPVYHDESGLSIYYPYIIASLFLVVLAALYGIRYSACVLRRSWLHVAMQLVFAVATVFVCWQLWYKDVSFYEELHMSRNVESGDWEEVLRTVRNHKGEPTRMMVTYKNLALFKVGRAGDEMYNYPDGSKEFNCPFAIRMAQFGGKNLYLYYGLPNYCYRWCLEEGVENGFRAEYLKLLTQCALLNEEWQVAKKYIELLKQTRYHGKWAEQYEALATPDGVKKLSEHPTLGPISQLMKGIDVLGTDQSIIELFLLNIQAYRRTTDLKTAELVLLSALQLKDINTFWRAFFQYATLKKDGRIPRHFQEAAYLYGNLEHTVDISHMPFDSTVVESCKAFMNAVRQYKGASEEQLKNSLYYSFGNTFYYNYFLMRNLKTY